MALPPAGQCCGVTSALGVELTGLQRMRFDDGLPVRAASAVAPLGDGWLVAQDDATSAAWVRPSGTVVVRVLPPVEGHDVFSEAEGTKHLKPDLEAACELLLDGEPSVLLLGSGSTPRRMRACLVQLEDDGPRVTVGDLTPLYAEVARALGIAPDELNLEGACRLGDTLRWFARGNLAAGVPSASVDLDAAALLAVVLGDAEAREVSLGGVRHYDLGEVEGVGLAVTDAVALPDDRVLVSASAEDTPNAVDDGPVVATALALLDGDAVVAVGALPEPDGEVHKVEGLALVEPRPDGARLLAVVDADDPLAPSVQLDLQVRWQA
ncbi:MAG: hypothetical protein M3P93_12135 [Actinomycetota bacterium]|nr:hypothetical protein [Actinomycetota bacterium]